MLTAKILTLTPKAPASSLLFHEITKLLSSLTIDRYDTGGNSFADGVSGFAHVSTRLFGISVENIQSDVTKVVSRFELVTLRDRSAVPVPLDDHCRIVYRRQSRFEMGALALGQVLDVLQRPTELRFLRDYYVLLVGSLVTGIVLEVLNLLQSTLVLSFADYRSTSCERYYKNKIKF